MNTKKAHSIIEHAEQHCKEKGVRLTSKRKQILLGLLTSKKALSAYELADAYKTASGKSIPAMSVYRILDFLEEHKLVHKLNMASKYVACSHISCSHEHDVPQFLICNQCQSVKELSVSKATIGTLQRNVKDAGFHLLSPQLEINGVCENCITHPA